MSNELYVIYCYTTKMVAGAGTNNLLTSLRGSRKFGSKERANAALRKLIRENPDLYGSSSLPFESVQIKDTVYAS